MWRSSRSGSKSAAGRPDPTPREPRPCGATREASAEPCTPLLEPPAPSRANRPSRDALGSWSCAGPHPEALAHPQASNQHNLNQLNTSHLRGDSRPSEAAHCALALASHPARAAPSPRDLKPPPALNTITIVVHFRPGGRLSRRPVSSRPVGGAGTRSGAPRRGPTVPEGARTPQSGLADAHPVQSAQRPPRRDHGGLRAPPPPPRRNPGVLPP